MLALDARRRELLPEVEALRARQNEASQGIARAKKAGEDASEAIAEMQEVSRRVKALGEELGGVEAELEQALGSLPNPPDPTAADEDTTLREVGEATATGARPPRAGRRRLIDMEAGARVAGSRFAYLKGDLVLLELALVRWALELLGEHGFEPVVPPVLVREEALFGTGFLPDTEQQIYRLADDALYLAGHQRGRARLAARGRDARRGGRCRCATRASRPCFRREAGAAGRDTRGIFRVHQFDKVEMFSFVRPEDAEAEHERLLAIEEEILQALEIPYRVVNIAVDDLGSSAAKKYDCEAWLPGQQRYRELTSTSNTTDFQARRLDIRYRPAEGGKPRHAHTLNGTAVAVGRHADRAAREPPARGRHGRRARGPAPVGCAADAAGRGAEMSETPITPDDPEIPDEPPPAEDGAPEVDDQPLGPPAELPEEDAPLPGLPEREPPAAD